MRDPGVAGKVRRSGVGGAATAVGAPAGETRAGETGPGEKTCGDPPAGGEFSAAMLRSRITELAGSSCKTVAGAGACVPLSA